MSNQAAPICVALDVPTREQALSLYRALRPHTDFFKIGPHLLMSAGPQIVRELSEDGAKIFLDMKFHDIPQTVYSACQQACLLRPYMFDVHALNGPEGMRRAVGAANESQAPERPKVLAVTVLVSHGPQYLAEYLGRNDFESAALFFADQARQAGVDGIVCSPNEASQIRKAHGPDFLIITPGVRFAASEHDDHSAIRIATFSDPRLKASSVIVAGRPIIAAADPVQALLQAQKLMTTV